MKTIDSEELVELCRNWKDNDLMLVNVLDPETFKDKHIPSSINVPIQDNPDFIQEMEQLAGSKNRMIVVYCANMECNASETAAEKLEDSGFMQVLDFEGGMAEWEETVGNVKAA